MTASQCLLLAFLTVVVLVEGGVVHDVPENRIVGGHKIDINDAPWQVALLLNNEYNCGGSIISDRWVLSAGHCTNGYNISDLVILIGTKSYEEGGIKYQVEKVVEHEKYRLGEFNDISALKSTIQMKLDFPVNRVMLPARWSKRPPVGSKLQVTGWGMMEDGTSPTLLMSVDVVVHDFKDCKTQNSSSEKTEICAGLPGKSACFGDSGGPLVKGNLLVGIVSYGAKAPCGDTAGSFYADVAFYRDWIKEHTGV